MCNPSSYRVTSLIINLINETYHLLGRGTTHLFVIWDYWIIFPYRYVHIVTLNTIINVSYFLLEKLSLSICNTLTHGSYTILLFIYFYFFWGKVHIQFNCIPINTSVTLNTHKWYKFEFHLKKCKKKKIISVMVIKNNHYGTDFKEYKSYYIYINNNNNKNKPKNYYFLYIKALNFIL